MNRILLLLIAFLPTQALSATIASLDDITFWVGEGANETALVIDWQGDNLASESLTWGYRWDDTATAEDMLLDVLAADSRLYAKLSTKFPSYGILVIGLGYDASGDGAFALQDETQFDSVGIATIPGTSDRVPPVDPADNYAEGWMFGFWHLSHRIDGNWSSSNSGTSGDLLMDDRWHGFAFVHGTSNLTAFPTNLITAEPPILPGDFNVDGTVDAADYAVWRDGLDTEYVQADYTVWRDNFGNTTTSTSYAIPEPATAWLVFGLLAMAWPMTYRKRQENCKVIKPRGSRRRKPRFSQVSTAASACGYCQIIDFAVLPPEEKAVESQRSRRTQRKKKRMGEKKLNVIFFVFLCDLCGSFFS